MKVELILEGGGMRGAYTSGVLDCFMDSEIKFKDIIAVSAGVASGMYYVSNQKGSAIKILTMFGNDKRYLSLKNLIKSGSAFGLDFIFKTIPVDHLPFNYDEFNNSDTNLIAVCTDINKGVAHYELIDKLNDKLDYAIASASLPFVSKIVRIDDMELLDGGIADAVPIKKSIENFDYQVIVLTRNEGYRKSKRKSTRLIAASYPFKPALRDLINNRHEVYNESIELAEAKVKEGKAIIIRPTEPLTIDRFERDPDKLMGLYNLGYNDAKNKIKEIINLCIECDNFQINNG